jgi:hypothetical protein
MQWIARRRVRGKRAVAEVVDAELADPSSVIGRGYLKRIALVAVDVPAIELEERARRRGQGQVVVDQDKVDPVDTRKRSVTQWILSRDPL